MTIEERLQRLTERHEALTQSIELMMADNRQRDERVERLTVAVEKLLEIAQNHERRIEHLEDKS